MQGRFYNSGKHIVITNYSVYICSNKNQRIDKKTQNRTTKCYAFEDIAAITKSKDESCKAFIIHVKG